MLAASPVGSSANGLHAPPPPPQPQLPHTYQSVQQPLPPTNMPLSMPAPPMSTGHQPIYSHQPPMPLPSQQPYYRPPAPPQQQPAPPQQAPQVPPDLNIDPGQRVMDSTVAVIGSTMTFVCCYSVQAMLMQVLALTPEQMNTLSATERDTIQQLVCFPVVYGHFPY